MDIVLQKHFVTFMSPGTFCHETSQKEIDSWDVPTAISMAREIKERHGATPFGFYFTTRGRNVEELDSKIIATSPTYYLGGVVETYEEVVARNLPDEKTLRWNMEMNNIKRIITNSNSWKTVQPLRDEDVVLQFDLNPPTVDEVHQ